MSEYIEQGSASDRYEAARKAIAALAIQISHERFVPSDESGHMLRVLIDASDALIALTTPPGVGETDEQIARRVSSEATDFPEGIPSEADVRKLITRGVRAGIQNAHETWEPEVALQPTQEQMLRWLGLDCFDSTDDEGEPSIFIRPQHIDREEM